VIRTVAGIQVKPVAGKVVQSRARERVGIPAAAAKCPPPSVAAPQSTPLRDSKSETSMNASV